MIGPGWNSIGGSYNGKDGEGNAIKTTWIVEDGKYPEVEFQNISAGSPNHEVPYFESTSGRTIILKKLQFVSRN